MEQVTIHPIYRLHLVEYLPCGVKMKIPLLNKFNERVGYATAEVADFRILLKYRYSKVNKGHKKDIFYAVSSGGPSMHQLLLDDPPLGYIIDHRDEDSLNNCRSNLRYATNPQNAQNTDHKTETSTSIYFGVSKNNPGKNRTDYGNWRAGIHYDGKSYNLGCFLDPQRAALQYDVWAIYFFGIDAKTNGLLQPGQKAWIVGNGIPPGFEKPEKIKRDLPEGISTTRAGTYRFRRIRNGKERSKTAPTLEEAIKVKIRMEEEWRIEDEEKERQRRLNITRNVYGIAYVLVKAPGAVYECWVDDRDWGEISSYAWSLVGNKYAKACINGHMIQMHNFIHKMHRGDIPSGLTVDHLDSRFKLDNRLQNLRLATRRLQGHNRMKFGNSLDRFKGVVFTGHSFGVIIEDRVHGYYETEEDAARVANQIYYQLYGADALLNVVPDTRTTKENRLPREMITREYIEGIGQVKELKHLIRVLGLNEGNGGPYNLEKTKGKALAQIKVEILSNKFESKIGMKF